MHSATDKYPKNKNNTVKFGSLNSTFQAIYVSILLDINLGGFYRIFGAKDSVYSRYANLLNSLYRPLSRSFLPPSLNDKSGHMSDHLVAIWRDISHATWIRLLLQRDADSAGI